MRIKTGFATFELTFHISYYTLRSATTNMHSLPTIALFSSSLHEAQVSLTVVGVSNNTWTSYCFIRVSDQKVDLEAEEGSSDSGYSDDEWGWHECDNRSEGIPDIETTDDGCKDPRKYWMGIITARVHHIVREWREIVYSVKTKHQEVRPRYVLKSTNDNTTSGFRSRAPSRILPRKFRTNFRVLALVA